MASRKAQELIGHPCYHRNQHNPAHNAQPDRIHPDDHKEQDADNHDNHDKAGAAPFMFLGACPYIVNRKLQPVLNAVDALML